MKALFPRRDGLPPAALLIALLALPQAAETILAPALPDLARHWRLDAALTQSVMGIYFLGFAAGVLLWGWLCDAWGRRPALLAGLCTGLAGTLCAAWAPGFEALLAGRFVQALGLATCSITTQTMLRDRLQGEALTRCFIMLGAVLSWSPALGPLAGQLLADQAGFAACWAASRRWPACCWRPDGRRSAKRGRPRQRASPCSGWRAACCATPSCCARPCWWPA